MGGRTTSLLTCYGVLKLLEVPLCGKAFSIFPRSRRKSLEVRERTGGEGGEGVVTLMRTWESGRTVCLFCPGAGRGCHTPFKTDATSVCRLVHRL